MSLSQKYRDSQNIRGRVLALRTFCSFLLLTTFFACSPTKTAQPPPEVAKPLAFTDDAIQRAAAQALAEREGTIIVLDPQNGRIRNVLNPRLAFEQTFPPGSTIKPFTALAAMRSGLANDDLRIQCGRQFKRETYQVACTHKRVSNSFRLHHAIAYSCNYYFSTLAERMNVPNFFTLLDAFGFGSRTGVNASEASGELKHDEWQLSTAIGNDERVLVTPIQLLRAFTALVNGGQLIRPRVADASKFAAQAVRNLNLNSAHRAVLIEGMQGCTQYGSAAEAGLDKLPFDVIGKTGTSGASNGFRTQGWFVSFLLNRKNAKTVQPEDLNIGVLVFLKRGHGTEAATVAADFYHRLIFSEQSTDNRQPTADNKISPPAHRTPHTIRIHLVRENTTVETGLEDYVRGVLAAEASIEMEPDALKAQAIISRTFARKNLGRHKDAGYDFCSLTHCQRYVNQLAEHNRALIMRAVEETAGQTLRDERGQIADVYFHAACGGQTTNLEAVWGAPSPSYLRSVKDDYCTTMSHRSWQQSIPGKDLLRALQSEERSSAGPQLDRITVTKRDASGRAEFVMLEGVRRKQLRGWDFALIVNRVLGWNMLKSSRFDVTRAGNNFVFRGSGFGHGLGLCQEGAHVMARRGTGYREIISHYFPGAKISEADDSAQKVNESLQRSSEPNRYRNLSLKLLKEARVAFHPAVFTPTEQKRRALVSSEHFRLNIGGGAENRDAAQILQTLETAQKSLQERLQSASIHWTANAITQVHLYDSTSEFMTATGQPFWTAAVTHNNSIQLQPLAVLRKRGILTTTLRHELAHLAIENLNRRQVSRWLVEGLAIHFAGEGRWYSQPIPSRGLDELEKQLAAPASAQEMKQLYALAYQEVRRLMQRSGEAKVWQKAILLQ